MTKVFDYLAVICFFLFITLFFGALCAEPNSEADWAAMEKFSRDWGKLYITLLCSTLAYLFIYIISQQVRSTTRKNN